MDHRRANRPWPLVSDEDRAQPPLTIAAGTPATLTDATSAAPTGHARMKHGIIWSDANNRVLGQRAVNMLVPPCDRAVSRAGAVKPEPGSGHPMGWSGSGGRIV